MKNHIKNILFLLLLFFTSELLSQEIEVKSNITYFVQKDMNKKIDINKEKFTYYDVKHSNFGFTKSIYWLKVKLKNISKTNVKYVLHFPYTLLDYIDIYELKNKELILKREYGDLREYKNDGDIPDPSLIVTLQADESKTYFYKIQTQGSMNIELLLSSYEDFITYSFEKSIVFSFYFGAVFIMLIYNLILYFYIKDKSYLYYFLFHINYLFFALSYNGISFAYIWGNIPFINNFVVPLLMSIGSTLAVIFTIEFLHIKTQSSKIYKLLKILLWINITMTLLVIFLNYHYSSIMASIISLISIVIILCSGLYSHFIIKNPNAKIFTLAWGALLMGIFIIHFRNIGILNVNIFTSYSPLIGAFIELTLLSIALAYRYDIQQEKLAEQSNILHKQSRQASMGEMLSNIAHQWRQPINRVNLSLEVIDEVMKDENIKHEVITKKIVNSQRNIQYMSQTIDDFTSFFAPDKKGDKFKIYDVLEKSLKLIESRLNGITVHKLGDKKIELDGFKNELIQVILIILNNAIDNFEIKNIKQRDIYIQIETKKDDLILSIRDNGGGIVKENINKIFDPYFTTKFKNEGTGLGLYMAKMLIEENINGQLQVNSNTNGVTFIIILQI